MLTALNSSFSHNHCHSNLYEEPSHFIEQKTQATCIEAMIKPLKKPTPEVMRFDGNPMINLWFR
jgi:hypothetical protein